MILRIVGGPRKGRLVNEDVEVVDVKSEEPSIDGRPDLVVFARERGKEMPILVMETKRKVS